MNPRPWWRGLRDQTLVLAVLAAIAWTLFGRGHPATEPTTVPGPTTATVPIEPIVPRPAPAPIDATPPAPAIPVVDEAEVAAARAQRDEARRLLAEAERAAAEAARRLESAELRAARDALAARSLGARVKDPAARLASLRQRGAALAAEQTALREELGALAAAPRPRRKPLVDKSPVARPAEGEEFHFEIRKDRVAYIELDRLIDRVKADASLQLRLSGGSFNRPLASSVGPIGDFALKYEIARDLPATLDEAFGGGGRGGVSYSLRSWELVPVRDLRGETLDALGQPASKFARVLNTLNPNNATITLWIYPDGFRLYRQVRDALRARGFMVAARPLPTGMAIRGSPGGSLSAGQ